MWKRLGYFVVVCLSLFIIHKPAAAQDEKSIRLVPETKSSLTKTVPHTIQIKLKQEITIDYETEISVPIPFTRQKWVIRDASYKFRNSPTLNELNKKFQVISLHTVNKRKPLSQLIKIELPPDINVDTAISGYAANPNVEYAAPIRIYQKLWLPNDPYLSYNPAAYFQWNLDRINLPQAWDYSPRGGSPEIKIAILDTGVAFENWTNGNSAFTVAPELSNVSFVNPLRLISFDESCNFLTTPIVDSHPNDQIGHGTHITSTIAQMTNNATAGAGIAFNASIIPIQIINDCGVTDIDAADAIYYAIDQGAKIINISFGGTEDSPTIHAAISAAVASNVTVVAAAGNSATRTTSPEIFYPAKYPEVISVGATRWDNVRAYYSNYGPELKLVAPGGQLVTDAIDNVLDQNNDQMPDGIIAQTIIPGSPNVFTAVGGQNFGYYCITPEGYLDELNCGNYQGTSMAAPHVTAVIALMLSLNPTLTTNQIKNILYTSAAKSTIPNYSVTEYGAGLVDARNALALTPKPKKYGDINNDGLINSSDLHLVLSSYSGNGTCLTYSCDLIQDNRVNELDAAVIQKLYNQ